MTARQIALDLVDIAFGKAERKTRTHAQAFRIVARKTRAAAQQPHRLKIRKAFALLK
ncbi:hypothetical protein YK56LOC_26500 [Caballeronia sp. HLA56]